MNKVTAIFFQFWLGAGATYLQLERPLEIAIIEGEQKVFRRFFDFRRAELEKTESKCANRSQRCEKVILFDVEDQIANCWVKH